MTTLHERICGQPIRWSKTHCTLRVRPHGLARPSAGAARAEGADQRDGGVQK